MTQVSAPDGSRMLPEDPNSQARLFYLLALGMLIAFWVAYRYRDRLGQAAQHAAIWALIFIGVVLAVGFAEPLKQSLFHDEALPIDGRTVVLDRARDGHFYATIEVNGTNVLFMIDTGASSIVLAREDAKRAGIDTSNLSFHIPTQTANGRILSAPVRLDSMRIAGFTDRDVRATVNSGPLSLSLLGMDYLDRFSGIRVEGDRFYFTR